MYHALHSAHIHILYMLKSRRCETNESDIDDDVPPNYMLDDKCVKKSIARRITRIINEIENHNTNASVYTTLPNIHKGQTKAWREREREKLKRTNTHTLYMFIVRVRMYSGIPCSKILSNTPAKTTTVAAATAAAIVCSRERDMCWILSPPFYCDVC